MLNGDFESKVILTRKSLGWAYHASAIFRPGPILTNIFSLERAQEFLSHFKRNPEAEALPPLAEEFGIDQKSAEALVEHFRVFYLYHVKKDEDVERRSGDPYLAQPDWVDADDDQPKRVLPVQPVQLKLATKETLRIGEGSQKSEWKNEIVAKRNNWDPCPLSVVVTREVHIE